jgi:NADPH:quinone reductase-like Zn-dependent oxidoreductase
MPAPRNRKVNTVLLKSNSMKRINIVREENRDRNRHLLRGTPYIARLQLGLRKPKVRVLGCDVAGHVEALGKNVTMLQPSDEVFGSPLMHGFGAFAE